MEPDDFRLGDQRLLWISGASLLLIALIALIQDASPPWKEAQAVVRREVAARVSKEAADALPQGMQQIWLEPLGRVDRCVSCHGAMRSGAALADAPHPARSHPHPELLAAHPIEEFGCTLCHGGQGAATTKDAAHGDVAFWEDPLLDTRRARSHGVTRAELMEMRCNTCHRHEREVKGMPLLNAAKAQVERKRCLRCHTIDGVGETEAPDLTYVGDKHPSLYVFPDDWRGNRTALEWHIRHFEDPQTMVPGSAMPTWMLEAGQAAGLALLVLSWRQGDLPLRYLPRSR